MDKQQELVDKYPELFEHAWPSVSDGWLPLLDTLCRVIKHHVKWQEKKGVTIVCDGEEPPEEGEWMDRFFFSQIKEKFGGLRVYSYGADDYIRGLTDFAEAMSYHTCEECGNAGLIRQTKWIKTLCDSCFSDWENIRQAKWDSNRERFLKENENKKKEYYEIRSLYEQVISRINKLDEDTKEAKGSLNMLVLDRFLEDITKLVGE